MKKLLPSLLLIIPLSIFSQENDFGIWSGVSLTKKIHPDWSLSFSEEYRTKENSTQTDGIFSETGIDYKPGKFYKIGMAYRFLQRNQTIAYSFRHRFQTEISLYYGLNKVKYSYRSRFQSQYSDYFTDEKGKIPKNCLRHKFAIEFDTDRRLTPEFSCEFYYNLKTLETLSLNLYTSSRYKASINYQFDKLKSLQIYYLMQNEFDSKSPVNSFITGIQFNYNLY